ncbi:putative choline transport protein [Rosellinia necatrix]|uniref:Putative choline transport protein n=1 Tax=Rosellinia necatrix TaxID=77044 RepID=A0A1S8A6Q2_ROSNE|nr:putative choline transport protein [Rosellinia necatrix]
MDISLEKGLEIVLKHSVVESTSRDDDALARIGKKPVLKRNFGFMSILGFSCTVLITWEGSLTYASLSEAFLIYATRLTVI